VLVFRSRIFGSVYCDDGYGDPDESLEVFRKARPWIGRVRYVALFSDLRYGMVVRGERGVILLSAPGCGYRGSGAHLALEILGQLGLVSLRGGRLNRSSEVARRVFECETVILRVGRRGE